MTQNTQQVPAPSAAGPQNDKGKLRFGAANAAAVVLVSGALIFAGLAKTCKPGPEKIAKKEKVCAVCAPAPSKPVKGDNKCEVDKGEHDPASAAFDLASCGYCGDDKQQDWESKETCPVDFRCEKGDERYKKTVFGAYKPLGDGRLELTTVTITENCKKDGGSAATGRRHRITTTVVAPRPVEPPRPVMQAGGKCPQDGTTELNAMKRSIRNYLGSKSTYFWDNGVDREKRHTISVTLQVSGGGNVTGVSVRVGGKSFGASSLGLDSFKGRSVGYAPGSACTLTFGRPLSSASD